MATPRLENYARQSVFDALAALFIHPETSGVIERFQDAVKIAGALAAELGMDPAPMDRLLEKPMPDPHAVQAEYKRLFLDDAPNRISLTESEWNLKAQLGIQAPRAACCIAYDEAEIAITDELGVPVDHLGMIFGFLTVLFLKENAAAAERFFDDHPAKWLAQLAAEIRRRPDAQFFVDAAEVLDTVLEIEATLREDQTL